MNSDRIDDSNMIYREAWWSVSLPPNWHGHRDGECVTFRAVPALGVLQISSAWKDTDNVTDQDLSEFAEGRLGPYVKTIAVRFGAFSGIMARYPKDGLLWQEWWLRSGRLMVYATYNVVATAELTEQGVISRILGSLVDTSR